MKKAQLMVLALLLGLLVVACAPQAAPPPQVPVPQATAPAPAPVVAPAAPTMPAWQVEWEKTLAAAGMEGRLRLISSGGELRTAMVEGFRAAYGIPVEAISGQVAALTAKILTERRAGLYLYDVYLGGGTVLLTNLKPAGALDPLSPALILPDVTDPALIKKLWYEGQLYWLDKDRIVLSTGLNPQFPIAINTNLIKEGEIKSWQDLLQPKWQGKIVLFDPRFTGNGQNFLIFCEDRLGWDYFVELIKTKPLVLYNARLMLDWLAHGKFAIGVAPNAAELLGFVKAGAPVRGLIPKEGTWMTGVSSNLAILNNRPHPNATKIFVNWLLSKEGQTVLAKAVGHHSTRLDVPTDMVPPDMVRNPEMKYVVTLSEEVGLRKPALAQKAKQLLIGLD